MYLFYFILICQKIRQIISFAQLGTLVWVHFIFITLLMACWFVLRCFFEAFCWGDCKVEFKTKFFLLSFYCVLERNRCWSNFIEISLICWLISVKRLSLMNLLNFEVSYELKDPQNAGNEIDNKRRKNKFQFT